MISMRNIIWQAWRLTCSISFYLFVWLRLYKIKSKLHRWLYDSKWNGVKIPSFSSLVEFVSYMNRFVWVKDSWYELFDAICTPQKVQAVLEAGDPKVAGGTHGNDCDEMGIWQLAALLNSPKLLALNGISRVFLFTVTWMEVDSFAPQGHNLTLVEFNNGQCAAIDYGWMQTVSNSIDDAARHIRNKYSDSKAASLGWSISDLDLTPLEIKI